MRSDQIMTRVPYCAGICDSYLIKEQRRQHTWKCSEKRSFICDSGIQLICQCTFTCEGFGLGTIDRSLKTCYSPCCLRLWTAVCHC